MGLIIVDREVTLTGHVHQKLAGLLTFWSHTSAFRYQIVFP